MARNSLFFRKRPKSLIKSWLGVKKAPKASTKENKPLFKKKTKKWKGTTVYDKG
jgi:hypothetical protein